ncbi:copper-binding protein [Methylocystis echinoides]|uniref:Copper-binding protein n=1 Tax=Methylocystis echinoides TaxID=29468 RepID=A0A9W6GZA3_9HYPH|nr:copper-binding protein [Methylocystis echinoides]GLI95863.1 hypothetical protein LMG27198_48550 [Methylocystis echinoides]
MTKILNSLALAGVVLLVAAPLSGRAYAGATDFGARPSSYAARQTSDSDGCFVTLSPVEATKGIRHWRPSCVDWYKRIEKLRPTQADPGEAPWVHVVVRKIDLPASRITVSHGAIPQIRMPAMTINFPVADAAQLAALHKGDEVDIQCDHRGGVVKVLNFRM